MTSPSVLVVDDDADFRDLLQLAWRSYGDLVLVPTLAAARAELGTEPGLRLVLLDLELDGEHGLDLLAWMKHEPDAGRVPVVVLTTNRDPYLVRVAHEAGAAGFVEKRGRLSELEEVCIAIKRYWVDVNIVPPKRPWPPHRVGTPPAPINEV